MSTGEFGLIQDFFAKPAQRHPRPDTRLGIGDDCALVCCRPGTELAITVDTLVSGVHFLADVDPESLGHKALAVNLSDLASMGASPAWCTLALTVPEVNTAWLEAFARGFFALAQRYGIQLIGGDTTRGPLSITLQAMGQIANGQALRRSGARPGDLIYVSGPLGTAGLGLKMRLGTLSPSDVDTINALERPEPRIELGRQLVGLATACIDISDGLAADLGHLLSASQVGAELDYAAIPLSGQVREYLQHSHDFALPLTAGDDYELCFTVPAQHRNAVDTLLARHGLCGAAIGTIIAEPGLKIHRDGHLMTLTQHGYDHFKQA